MRYFISDLHFNHNKEFIYKDRGFSCIEEMNETLIDRFNSVVTSNDEAYILGDTMLGELTDYHISKLNGNIKFIRGNHDTNNRIELYKNIGWEYLGDSYRLKSGKYTFYLSHYKTDVSNTTKDRVYNIHGHTHSFNFRTGLKKFNVSVEALNGYPISEDELRNKIIEYNNTNNGYYILNELFDYECPYCKNIVTVPYKYCGYCGEQVDYSNINN